MLITLLPAVMAAAVMQAPPSPQGFGEARPSLFDYDKAKPADIRFTSPAVTVRHLTYAQLDGTTNGATLVTPPATARPRRVAQGAVQAREINTRRRLITKVTKAQRHEELRYMIFVSWCLSDLRGVSRGPVWQSLYQQNS
jgi:hypothetical protein